MVTPYCVAGISPESVAEGVALLKLSAAPPPTGLTVKTYATQGPPELGVVAAAAPCVGPVASAEVSVGAAGGDIDMARPADGGVFPILLTAVTETS
jgi:hypothetical protein